MLMNASSSTNREPDGKTTARHSTADVPLNQSREDCLKGLVHRCPGESSIHDALNDATRGLVPGCT